MRYNIFFFFFDGPTARRGPWPPLQYASKPLDPLLCLSIRLFQSFSSSSSMALQPGVGLGLLYNTPPNLSIPCSDPPFVYSYLSQVRGHVIQPSHFWSSSSSCSIQLSVHLFFGIAVSCILSIWPNHHILWHFINLTMFSPLIIASNSSFEIQYQILHIGEDNIKNDQKKYDISR